MKRLNKKLLIIIAVIIVIIAGLLDLKFEGLFYQMLPESFQSMISNFLMDEVNVKLSILEEL